VSYRIVIKTLKAKSSLIKTLEIAMFRVYKKKKALLNPDSFVTGFYTGNLLNFLSVEPATRYPVSRRT
jgi:hypothetical protein